MKITDSVKKITLNADNRAELVKAVLSEALKKRSDDVRQRTRVLILEMIERTWGETPQARTATKKRFNELRKKADELEQRGVCINLTSGKCQQSLMLNLGGLALRVYFTATMNPSPVVDFQSEFLSGKESAVKCEFHTLASGLLTLPTDDPLTVRLFALRDEAQSLADASVEISASVYAMLNKCRTVGAALEKWPELEKYLTVIMSKSREIIVRPDVLNDIVASLALGKDSVDAIMSKSRGYADVE